MAVVSGCNREQYERLMNSWKAGCLGAPFKPECVPDEKLRQLMEACSRVSQSHFKEPKEKGSEDLVWGRPSGR